MNSELQSVSSDEWKETVEKLTIYAYHKTLRLHWETPSGTLSKGYEPKDLAFGAIGKVLSGERKWEPARHDLLTFLKSVVDSMTSHLVQSPDNFRRTRNSRQLEDTLSRMPTAIANPEQAAVVSELVESMRASLKDDSELSDLFERILVGQKPQEIALELGKSQDDVYGLIRRLKRHLKSNLQLGRQASVRV